MNGKNIKIQNQQKEKRNTKKILIKENQIKTDQEQKAKVCIDYY